VTQPTVLPNPLYTADTATCTGAVGSDPNLDPVTLRYGWLVNGADIGIAALLLTSDQFVTGDTVQCIVTPNDGVQDGPSATSDPVTVDGCPLGSGESATCPGVSCLTILQAGYSVGDGDYWIDPMGTGAFQAYCDQTTDSGGWTRITNDDYSADACPGAWVADAQYGGLCARASTTGADFIRSATFDVWDIQYTEVRGHIESHQYGSCDAFGDNPPTSIDDTYADVVSFSVGPAGSRTHLFSYVFGFGTTNSDDSNCPSGPGGAPPHGWVGANFVCASGNQGGGNPGGVWHPTVMFPGHWFQSSVGTVTTEDVEGRLIATHASSDEDLGVTELTLFVR
jgi:hypothetical protein